jgi:hypothetical protein
MSATDRLDLLTALLVIDCWLSPQTEPKPPELPELEAVRKASDAATSWRMDSLTSYNQAASLVEYFDRWVAEWASVSSELNHVGCWHAVLLADVLAALSEHIEATRRAQAARRARGKGIDAWGVQKLAQVEALNGALVTYDAALHRSIGHERLTRASTYWGDQLRERMRAARRAP